MAIDWDPERYGAFRDLRLRPALDLLARVPEVPLGDIVDLGCGNGAVAAALSARFPGRTLTGVDSSAAMLAGATGYARKVQADIAGWQPDLPPALIFSNAALHWLGDHASLFPRLAGMLCPGGSLAVQMPRNHGAPSHRLLREIAGRLFPDRFDSEDCTAPTGEPAAYWHLLSPSGRVDLWESEYFQMLDPVAEGHPVRAFTASTTMRPFLERLSAAEAARFTGAYDTALAKAYPLLPDGSVLFPFRRLFLILTRS